MQNRDFNTRIASLYGSQPSSVVFACKTATLWSELIVSMGPRPHLSFLHRSQTLPVVLCLQNNVISIRITSLYVSQPWSVGFACKTAPFGSVSMSPTIRLLICECKTAWLSPELLVSMGHSPHLWFCVFKRATLAPELQVSMVPSPHLWFLHIKLRL